MESTALHSTLSLVPRDVLTESEVSRNGAACIMFTPCLVCSVSAWVSHSAQPNSPDSAAHHHDTPACIMFTPCLVCGPPHHSAQPNTCEDRIGTGPPLDTDEFIPHEAGSPFGWIDPEIAQYPKSA